MDFSTGQCAAPVDATPPEAVDSQGLRAQPLRASALFVVNTIPPTSLNFLPCDHRSSDLDQQP